MQYLRPIGEDEGEIDVGRPLLGGAAQRCQYDLLWLPLDHLERRCPLDPLLRNDAPENRRFEDTEPDVEPDRNHDDAQQERNTPAPDQELVARDGAEHQYRHVREKQPGRSTELRPRRDE